MFGSEDDIYGGAGKSPQNQQCVAIGLPNDVNLWKPAGRKLMHWIE